MVVCKEGTQDIWGENALRTLKWAADFGFCFTQLKQTASVRSFPCRLKQTSVFGWDTGMVGGMDTFCTENSIVLGLARMQMVFHCWNWWGKRLGCAFTELAMQAFKKSLNNNTVQVTTWKGQLLDSFFFFNSNQTSDGDMSWCHFIPSLTSQKQLAPVVFPGRDR